MTIKKAIDFCEEAEKNGWETKVMVKNETETHVEATRKNERITIWWDGNRLIETPFHHYQGQARSLHNKADATRQLSKKPSAKGIRSATKARFSVIKTDPKTGEAIIPDDADIDDLRYDLPFSMDDSDAKILKELRGSTVIFLNRISGHAESVNIPRLLNMDLENVFYLEDSKDGDTYVSFLATTGFRSVYLKSILRVI